MNELASTFEKVLPDVLWRHRWEQYREQYGVPFSRGTMANRDSEGRGPKSGKVGKKVYYTKADFLAWLAEQK